MTELYIESFFNLKVKWKKIIKKKKQQQQKIKVTWSMLNIFGILVFVFWLHHKALWGS